MLGIGDGIARAVPTALGSVDCAERGRGFAIGLGTRRGGRPITKSHMVQGCAIYRKLGTATSRRADQMAPAAGGHLNPNFPKDQIRRSIIQKSSTVFLAAKVVDSTRPFPLRRIKPA